MGTGPLTASSGLHHGVRGAAFRAWRALRMLAGVALLPLLAAAADPPLDLGGPEGATAETPGYAQAAVAFSDGRLESFFRRSAGGTLSIFCTRSANEGRTWSTPVPEVGLPIDRWGGPVPLLDRSGVLHFVIPKVRGDGRRPNVDRFIDLYHVRSTADRSEWSQPQRIYEGYCGALQGVFQLQSGRIIAPFADWLPGVPTAPPTGPSVTTCVYSDDGGRSWQRSPARLTAPCHEGYNGGNYGACEPTLIELAGGRVWMLIRTQDGYLYESFSSNGVDWSPATRSRFHSSNSPAFPLRLPDGRIVVFWNNCEMPPRVDGEGVYGGRDALHAAISADEGKTWQGFREVYRDPTRNSSPPQSGDRGTAYPHATVTASGKILLVSGQGANRRRRFLVDPDWLLETAQVEHLEDLEAWHVFKGFGAASRFWRDREPGPQLIPHPDRSGAQALHLRRPPGRDADGAVWNFPAGRNGRLVVRMQIRSGCGGAQLSLVDRMFDPSDDQGERQAQFAFPVGNDGPMTPNRWHQVELAWRGEHCSVAVDDQPVTTLTARTSMGDGVSYLRLRSLAQQPDTAGFLVDSVTVTVDEGA